MKRKMREKYTDSSISEVHDYFRSGPDFLSIRRSKLAGGEYSFKPPSRSSQWVGAVYTGVKSYVNHKNDVVSLEHTFIAMEKNGMGSEKGDSGALLLDENFRPFA